MSLPVDRTGAGPEPGSAAAAGDVGVVHHPTHLVHALRGAIGITVTGLLGYGAEPLIGEVTVADLLRTPFPETATPRSAG